MLIVYSYSLFFSSKNKTLSNSVHLVPQCKERESKEKSKSSSKFSQQRLSGVDQHLSFNLNIYDHEFNCMLKHAYFLPTVL